MNERTTKIARMSSAASQHDDLPYSVELVGQSENAPERVLALARDGNLAHAIFRAAQKEYPDRRIVLRRGSRVVADTAAE
jgi:hypothetical protein